MTIFDLLGRDPEGVVRLKPFPDGHYSRVWGAKTDLNLWQNLGSLTKY